MIARARWIVAALPLALAACAQPLAPTPPSPVAAAVATAPAPLTATAPPQAPDPCGAAELAGLVGQPRTEIPISVDLTRRRVVCSSCPLSEDVRPDRQTILYDAATNRITAVQCR